MTKGFIFWLLPVVLLSGCSDDSQFLPKKYSLVSGADGVYRLNNANGEVSWVRNGKMTKVRGGHDTANLEKDCAYKTEDKRYVVYLGKGRFESLSDGNKAPLAGTNKLATVSITKQGAAYVIEKTSDDNE